MKVNSSLISDLDYEDGKLTVSFHYGRKISYNVPPSIYAEMLRSESLGAFYNTRIKSKYKTVFYSSKIDNMADEKKQKPRGINKAKAEKRFIKISIDTKKINKSWLHVGEKGTYLNVTMMMLPDGEVDSYECLGMIVQDVPEQIRKADSTIKGPILGNGAEYEWKPAGEVVRPGEEVGQLAGSYTPLGGTTADPLDDLPF